MRIVLLGATGFLGHHLLPLLSSVGHECLVLTRYRPACRDLVVLPGVTVKQVRSWDTGKLTGLFEGADAVINMVGILNEKGRNGDGFRKVHVDLLKTIISSCKAAGVRRVVQISAVGAGAGESHYLKSKGEAEQILRAEDQIDETIIQPSVIFGRGDDFFNRFSTLLKALPVLPLACPQALMQPVWVGDVAALIEKSLSDESTIGETLIAVGPHEYRLQELVEFTSDAAGLKRRVVGLPDWMSKFQASLMDFVPGKPFSSDNFLSLQTPNCSEKNSLWRFGIKPSSIESVVPGYLRQGEHQRRLDECRRWINR